MSKDSVFSSDEQDSQALLNEFLQRYEYFTEEDKSHITDAWNFLVEISQGMVRSCGKPYYVHPLRVANILATNKLDSETIVAAILHPLHNFDVSPDVLKEKFGETVNNILITVNKILTLPINSMTLQQADALRKMLFAMCDDARVILITLADRLDRIRNIKNMEKEEQRILGEAVIEIWAPLADRLGMQAEKNEFEDLSLKYKNPAVFQQIKAIVSQKKEERSNYLEKAVNSIYKSAEKMGIQVTISSRAKHFYSIYQKMRKRNKDAGDLFDLLALRVLCNTTTECYTIIGIVHGLWKPLDGRFKDYIAMPKANGYQSIHTTVMCEGKPLEIQIRTYEMHNMAEHGIASHWLYKKGTNKDLVETDKLDIFNKLQKLKETGIADNATFTTLKNELLGDEIYVFTPKGDVRKLPAGSTAIDFAYAIHSHIGEKIIAAKANGKIIPLTKKLENTQIIEVITNPQAHPTEAQLKIVKTTKAHQRIHSWLMANDPTFSERVVTKTDEPEQNVPQKKKRSKKGVRQEIPLAIKRRVLVQGDKNVLYNIAQCCNPKYPDLIAGYVTRMKGVTVHRVDCLIYQRIPNKEQRSVEVSWDTDE